MTTTPFSFTCPAKVLAQAVAIVRKSGRTKNLSLRVSDGICTISGIVSSAEVKGSSEGSGCIVLRTTYLNDILNPYKKGDFDIQITNEFIKIDKICISL